ncbi:hypothetical protein GCM10017783_18760 [Deinococcus piscis]|uniref:protein-N(pi)-phosphohistidine--sucrose phosphotransferase n=1 Tax=Deinococcus piscis TaxID=394230 RepID=A0ABQ3KA48_9DEIO|nr:sucrose-specific PTS transporter subunit IIBC [Deinococcus piscis]GHG06377.1 hypothetical protein GCM10017783_18760 [Deinococcus piscis]
MNEYTQAAGDILAALGGRDNVRAATHCATRLRLVLNDESRVDQAALDALPVTKGTFSNAGQYQIVLGTGTVNRVYDEFVRLAGVQEVSKEEAGALGAEAGNPVQRLVKLLSDIFVPIIPAIVAGGLLMGLNNLLVAPDLFFKGRSLIDAYPQYADLAAIINMFANAPFVFLPVLIGFSATRIFGGNPYLGAALAMIMVHPDLLNAYGYGAAKLEGTVPTWNLLGLSVEKVGYQGTVLPVLVLSWILATLEKFFRRIVPAALDLILTPLLALFITGVLTFTLVGPLTRSLGDGLTAFLTWLYDTAGPLGAGLFGLFYAPIVITGMHHSFIAIETQLLADMARTAGSFIFPIAAMSNMAQGGATFGAMLATRDQKLKGVASAAGVSAVLGITEPAMFGVNLKLRYPFYAAMLGAGLASAFITVFGTKAVALGAAGIPGIISIRADTIPYYIMGMVISFGVAFVGTLALARSGLNPDRAAAPLPATGAQAALAEAPLGHSAALNPSTLDQSVGAPARAVAEPPAQTGRLDGWVMPLSGTVLPLSAVPDPVFSSGAMGPGFAIEPSSGEVRAPLSGTVQTLFPTGHAIGLKTDSGLEVLIHVGLDTVNLQGRGFTPLVAQGDRVEAGQPLLRADLDTIRPQVPSLITPVILTNLDEGQRVEVSGDQVTLL